MSHFFFFTGWKIPTFFSWHIFIIIENLFQSYICSSFHFKLKRETVGDFSLSRWLSYVALVVHITAALMSVGLPVCINTCENIYEKERRRDIYEEEHILIEEFRIVLCVSARQSGCGVLGRCSYHSQLWWAEPQGWEQHSEDCKRSHQ